MSGVSDSATAEKKKIAIQLLLLGRSYRQIASILGVSKSTISDWKNGDKQFQQALEEARATQNENQAEVLDAYKMALFRAAEEAGKCVTTLVAIANDPDTRSSDRLKAIEMLFGRADKLMAFLEQEAQFPQEAAIAKQREQEREKIWKLELQAANWKESFEGSGYWFNPQDGIEYDTETAYRQLHKQDLNEKQYKELKFERIDKILIDTVSKILQKATNKTTKDELSLEELKQLSLILRNLKAVTSGEDWQESLIAAVNHELIPWDKLPMILEVGQKSNESLQREIEKILNNSRN